MFESKPTFIATFPAQLFLDAVAEEAARCGDAAAAFKRVADSIARSAVKALAVAITAAGPDGANLYRN